MATEVFLPFEHMDNSQPPALPEAPTQKPETAPSKPPVTKKDEVLGCGCLIIIALGLVMLLKSCFFGGSPSQTSTTDSPDVESEEVASDVPSNAWLKLDKGTRKKMAEQKYGDAEKLSAEMDELLAAANSGRLSADVIGRISIWKGNVRSVIKEVEQTECHRSFSSSATAMGKVHSALENMTFAWDALEKFEKASTERDRNTYASMHANHLKLVKECLHDSREWMAEGEY